MYKLTLNWKSFNVNMGDAETWLRTNAGQYYAGNSADSQLTLWFSQKPDQATIDSITDWWNAIDTSSTFATRYVSVAQINAAISTLRSSLVLKSWDQMSTAERKLATGQMPTLPELGF